jgi:hypothetical protein
MLLAADQSAIPGDCAARASTVQRKGEHLELALAHWQSYAAAATRQHRPQLLTRIGYADLNALTEQVRGDIQIAKEWRRP